MKLNKNFINGSILFIILLILFFREYLYTYRMMMVNFVPYDFYQNQIIYFSTFDETYKLTIPSAVRLIPIFFYYILFKISPCLKLTSLDDSIPEVYTCATHAVALGNYILLILILVVFLFYQKIILNKSDQDAYLGLILCYAVIKYLDHFTIDRFVVFYLILILFFINNLKLSIFLVLLSFLVSEKVFFITGFLFFLRLIFQSENRKYFLLFISSVISCVFYYFLIKIGKYYFEFFEFEFNIKQMFKMFYNKSAVSGSLLPLLISLTPYMLWNKEIERNYPKQRIEFLIPISLILFGIFGGVENTARYITHSFPIWLPILSTRINHMLMLKK